MVKNPKNELYRMNWLVTSKQKQEENQQDMSVYRVLFQVPVLVQTFRNKSVTRIEHDTPWDLWNASTRMVNFDLTSIFWSILVFME
jgi:hypothetical protein